MKILPNRNKFNPGHDVTKIKENKERRLGEDEDKERKRKGAASWKKMEREREREAGMGERKRVKVGFELTGLTLLLEN